MNRERLVEYLKRENEKMKVSIERLKEMETLVEQLRKKRGVSKRQQRK